MHLYSSAEMLAMTRPDAVTITEAAPPQPDDIEKRMKIDPFFWNVFEGIMNCYNNMLMTDSVYKYMEEAILLFRGQPQFLERRAVGFEDGHEVRHGQACLLARRCQHAE